MGERVVIGEGLLRGRDGHGEGATADFFASTPRIYPLPGTP